MAYLDPTKLRLSEHFLLSDFMGNHSVYTRGLANVMHDDGRLVGPRIANAIALCDYALEPILRKYGPLSISYGYISPEVSRQIVTYQDPDKPSHHRWDLGAAADICVHGWVNSDPDDDTLDTAPIALAHDIDDIGIPYSRLITYSESPYLCMAVSAREIETGVYRKAFYENRYTGKAKDKPDYRSMSSAVSRERQWGKLVGTGLTHGWRGAGYPTYHGGGRRQSQHIRISEYTMLSDWLFDVQSIAQGAKNIPNMRDPDLWRTLYAVGDAYDAILRAVGVNRMSIVAGYLSPSNPFFCTANDWRTGKATFGLVPPASLTADDVRRTLLFHNIPGMTGFGSDPVTLDITVEI